MNLRDPLQPFRGPAEQTRRGVLADSVHGQHGRLIEGRAIERARCVREMVIGEKNPGRLYADTGRQSVADPELLRQPGHHRTAEGDQAAGKLAQMIEHQPLEFAQRLFVVHDPIEIARLEARLRQAPARGQQRHGGVVLDPRETFLAAGGDDHAVVNQRRGRVVIEGGDAEDVGQVCDSALSAAAGASPGAMKPATGCSVKRATIANGPSTRK